MSAVTIKSISKRLLPIFVLAIILAVILEFNPMLFKGSYGKGYALEIAIDGNFWRHFIKIGASVFGAAIAARYIKRRFQRRNR